MAREGFPCEILKSLHNLCFTLPVHKAQTQTQSHRCGPWLRAPCPESWRHNDESPEDGRAKTKTPHKVIYILYAFKFWLMNIGWPNLTRSISAASYVRVRPYLSYCSVNLTQFIYDTLYCLFFFNLLSYTFIFLHLTCPVVAMVTAICHNNERNYFTVHKVLSDPYLICIINQILLQWALVIWSRFAWLNGWESTSSISISFLFFLCVS